MPSGIYEIFHRTSGRAALAAYKRPGVLVRRNAAIKAAHSKPEVRARVVAANRLTHEKMQARRFDFMCGI